MTRLMTRCCLTTCAALAKAASVAALSPWICDEADVVLAVVPHQRRARRLAASAVAIDGGQRLVVDLDQFGGVHRLVLGLGHDEGDVVADPAHPVLDQRRIARPVIRRAVAALVRPPGTGRSPQPDLIQSSPVSTQSTPGAALALACRSSGFARGHAASAAHDRTPCRAARCRRHSGRRPAAAVGSSNRGTP